MHPKVPKTHVLKIGLQKTPNAYQEFLFFFGFCGLDYYSELAKEVEPWSNVVNAKYKKQTN